MSNFQCVPLPKLSNAQVSLEGLLTFRKAATTALASEQPAHRDGAPATGRPVSQAASSRAEFLRFIPWEQPLTVAGERSSPGRPALRPGGGRPRYTESDQALVVLGLMPA